MWELKKLWFEGGIFDIIILPQNMLSSRDLRKNLKRLLPLTHPFKNLKQIKRVLSPFLTDRQEVSVDFRKLKSLCINLLPYLRDYLRI